MTDLIVRGKYVMTDAAQGEQGILHDGAVYCSQGLIVEVGAFASIRRDHPEVEVKGNGRQLLMPGLIDAHSHGEGLTTLQRGQTFDYLENGLLDWASLVEIDPELNSMLSAVRHLRSGCTTMHHNNWGESSDMYDIARACIQGYNRVGIRLAFSPGARNMNILALDEKAFLKTLPADLKGLLRPVVSLDPREIEQLFFDVFERLHAEYDDTDSRIILGPSWVHGSTPEFLQRVKEKADSLGKIPIHIHTLQTPWQKVYGLRKFGTSLVKYLDDLKILDDNVTLGHAVLIDQSDIELMAQRGVSITNHASCNLAVRNGIAPVYQAHRAGVQVALGIDDKGINDDEDVIMELRMMHKLHRIPGFDLVNLPALDAFDILTMGTIHGAQVCGFAGEIGQLKPMMKADMILIDLEEIMDDPWMSPDISIAEVFVHRALGRHVHTTIVGGEIIMEDRVFKSIDVEALYREVRGQASKGLSEDAKSTARAFQRLKPYYHRWYANWLDDISFDPFYPLNSRY